MKPKVVLSGGSGLLALNWAIHERDRSEIYLLLHNRSVSLQGINSIHLGLDDVSSLVHTLQQIKADYFVHTAAMTNVDACEKNPPKAMYVNMHLSRNVALACKEVSIPLVHISTDHLFDGHSMFYSEEDMLSPINVYARSKAEAERAVLSILPSSLIIRTNFFGWGTSYRDSFSDWIVKSLEQNNQITLFEDVYFTPIVASELINSINNLHSYQCSGIFNVVSDERLSKYDFGIKLAHLFDLPIHLINSGNSSEFKQIAKRPLDMSLSNSKIVSKFGCALGSIEDHIEILRGFNDSIRKELSTI